MVLGRHQGIEGSRYRGDYMYCVRFCVYFVGFYFFVVNN